MGVGWVKNGICRGLLTEILNRQEGIGYANLFSTNKMLESWKLLRR